MSKNISVQQIYYNLQKLLLNKCITFLNVIAKIGYPKHITKKKQLENSNVVFLGHFLCLFLAFNASLHVKNH